MRGPLAQVSTGLHLHSHLHCIIKFCAWSTSGFVNFDLARCTGWKVGNSISIAICVLWQLRRRSAAVTNGVPCQWPVFLVLDSQLPERQVRGWCLEQRCMHACAHVCWRKYWENRKHPRGKLLRCSFFEGKLRKRRMVGEQVRWFYWSQSYSLSWNATGLWTWSSWWRQVTMTTRRVIAGVVIAILVIFGRRALIFFLFESSWKNMKIDTTFVRMRSGDHLGDAKMSKMGTSLRRMGATTVGAQASKQNGAVVLWNPRAGSKLLFAEGITWVRKQTLRSILPTLRRALSGCDVIRCSSAFVSAMCYFQRSPSFRRKDDFCRPHSTKSF